MTKSATLTRNSTEWLPAMKFEGGDCVECGKEANMSFDDDPYCSSCAQKVVGFALGIEKPRQETEKEVSHKATDYLIGVEQTTQNQALKNSLEQFLLRNTAELIKQGDNWVATKAAHFLQDTETTRDNSEAMFISPWFTLQAGDENLGQKLQDTQELLQVLGFQEAGTEQTEDLQITGYKSVVFPSLQLGRQKSTDGKHINYIVGKIPGNNIAVAA